MASSPQSDGRSRSSGSDYTRVPRMIVWAITINRQIHEFECAHCMKFLEPEEKEKAQKIQDIGERFRFTVGCVLPRLALRRLHTRRPPDWFDPPYSYTDKTHKSYLVDPQDPGIVLGYGTAWAKSIVSIAYSRGRKNKVVYTGMDIMQLVIPQSVSASEYVASLAHKLTRNEEAALKDTKSDVTLRRLCVVLTVKTAYIRALGRQLGFDLSRVECDVPNEQIIVDGLELTGWEFRLFIANLGVDRNGQLIEETYQCAVAIFRGGDEPCTFILGAEPAAAGKWLHFRTLEDLLYSLNTPKLPPESGSYS